MPTGRYVCMTHTVHTVMLDVISCIQIGPLSRQDGLPPLANNTHVHSPSIHVHVNFGYVPSICIFMYIHVYILYSSSLCLVMTSVMVI